MKWSDKQKFDLIITTKDEKYDRTEYGVKKQPDSQVAILFKTNGHFIDSESDEIICLKTCQATSLIELAGYFENLPIFN